MREVNLRALAAAAMCVLALPAVMIGQESEAPVAQQEVRKSRQGICHDESSLNYDTMRTYESFESMDDCIASGGRPRARARVGPSASAPETADDASEDQPQIVTWFRGWWEVWMAYGIGVAAAAIIFWPNLRGLYLRYKARRAKRAFEQRTRREWEGHRRDDER